jgi:phage recombination protein Bet
MDLNDEIDLYIKSLPKTDYKKNKLVPPTVDKVAEFRLICQRTGLSPVTRQIYLIPRWDRNSSTTLWAPQTSIDGFRAIAARSPKYQGQAGPFWTSGPDSPWTDIPPADDVYAAKVGVYIEGRAEPTWAVARFDDYNAGGPMWDKMGPTMIAKCAEALALRKALPGEMAGLYTSEEMQQAEKSAPKPPREKKPKETVGLSDLRSGETFLRAARSLDELNKAMRSLQPDQQVELVQVYQSLKQELQNENRMIGGFEPLPQETV